MGISIGPNPWWQQDLVSGYNEGDSLPDGSRIICKACRKAWIVAPSCTQVSSTWSSYPATLCSQLISCGFNPCDWFVPCYQLLQDPGYVCSNKWDPSATLYWSSTECGATNACIVNYSTGTASCRTKTSSYCVRAFRCVTY